MSDINPAIVASTVPWLSIGGQWGGPARPGATDRANLRLRSTDLAAAVSDPLWRQGFFALRPGLEGPLIDDLARGVLALSEADLPPTLIFMFDQAWDLIRLVAPVARYLLGDDARLLPHLWAWHVGSGGSRAGWPPHKDASGTTVLDAGGMGVLMSLSLWIPLTGASPENGCMAVLPHYPGHDASDPSHPAALPVLLPAPAGSILGWRQDLWHWGGHAQTRAKTPRISLALEFQAAFVDPPLATPLIDPSRPPAPAERSSLVEAQFDKYQHIGYADID